MLSNDTFLFRLAANLCHCKNPSTAVLGLDLIIGFSTGLDLIPDFLRPLDLRMIASSLGCLLLSGPAAMLVGCCFGMLAVQRKVAESSASCDSQGLPTRAATTRVQRPPDSSTTLVSGVIAKQGVDLGCLLLLRNRLLRF